MRIKEREAAPAPDPAPEHDVHPVTPPAADPAGAKVALATIAVGAHVQRKAHYRQCVHSQRS